MLVALHDREDAPATADQRLAWLQEAIARNRFLPQPPEELAFVGDGDFRAIGAEFLGHLVRLGGLTPDARVLDIGCGTGRLAAALTQYLDPDAGRYFGVDPVRPGIDWCIAAIAAVYPAFTFSHLDVRHPIYNPGGAVRGTAVALPFPADAFDFAFMVSVMTHLPPAEVAAYAHEAARVLRPGGRLFVTAFVIDRGAEAGGGRLAFERAAGGPAWLLDPANPLAAIAFSDGFLDGTLERAGLTVVRKQLGHWRGREAAHYQDILVAEKREPSS